MPIKIPISYFFLIIVTFLNSNNLHAQPAERYMSRTQYIEKFSEEAVNQMVEYKIPASITLAQGILESSNGNSELAKYGNNHFGIKCHNWEGQTIYQDDDKKNECFRKYSSAMESYKDHSVFLSTRSRYSSLFELKLNDYKGWAKGLKKAGYATNPKYASILIELIENHQLYKFDESSILARSKKTATISKSGIDHIHQPISHSVEIHSNNIKFIRAKKGDTFYGIAKEFEMGMWQIYKYNDLKNGDILKEDDIIFLQPKRNRSRIRYHIVKSGDDLNTISQHYGVKLKRISRLNKLKSDSNLITGSKIYLKKFVQ